jgi:hypothetical protein
MDIRTYSEVIRRLHESNALEKHAQRTRNPSDLEDKTTYDCVLFEHIKEAGGKLEAVGDIAKRVFQHPVGKGLGIAAGAAVPAAATGSYLIGRGGEEARKTTEDVRNKALQVALATALMGGGLIGLHRLTRPDGQKAAAHRDEQQILEKLATVGYLDAVLEHQVKVATTIADREQADHCKMLNAEHGVALLKQLLL